MITVVNWYAIILQQLIPRLLPILRVLMVLFGEHYANSFDKILVDAPCSGLGALRRRP